MWLINTKTLTLELFDGPVTKPYAILSHTWADDEVTFEDMRSGISSAKAKKGFAKIKATCQTAIDNDLQYAWVDTCCIDKSSSAELSEAINSMFGWYKNASVCYAFLSDLPKGGLEEVEPKQLEKCRWFTRGWTLQELIAPANLKFYDEEWNFRGTKTDLDRDIEAITGVDEWVLHDSTLLSSIPLARRMSWAARRKTTRVEDLAYCLMGIFDVNMPLVYGEGAKAFIRLQEEILKNTTDLSLFAWQAEQNAAMQAEKNTAMQSETNTTMQAEQNATMQAEQNATMQAEQNMAMQSEKRMEYRGILAKFPAEFLKCGKVVSSGGQFRFRDEISMTNKGVKINTALYYRDDGILMDLHCYQREYDGKTTRIGIYLQQVLDTYLRKSPDKTSPITGRPGNYPRPIYLISTANEDIINTLVDDDRCSRIYVDFLTDMYHHYKVHDIKAVPEAYWHANEQFFSVYGLSHFIGFVRFCVTSRMSSVPPNYKTASQETWQIILICEMRKAGDLRMRLDTEKSLLSNFKPAGFICPFKKIDHYGPLGDPLSLSVLAPGDAKDDVKRISHRNHPRDCLVTANLEPDADLRYLFRVKVRVVTEPKPQRGLVGTFDQGV